MQDGRPCSKKKCTKECNVVGPVHNVVVLVQNVVVLVHTLVVTKRGVGPLPKLVLLKYPPGKRQGGTPVIYTS